MLQRIHLTIFVQLFITTWILADTIEPKDTSYWNHKNQVSIFFNQSAFGDYWKGGGTNSIATGLEVKISKDYKKESHSWQSKLLFNYGIIKLGKNNFQKNNDRIQLDSKYSYHLKKNFLISTLFSFNSRLHDTYQIMETGERGKLIGNFLAPGYFNIGSGINYELDKKTLVVYYTPLNSKITTVINEQLKEQFIPQ